jgi:HAE1 family hydrophobic/amphiphilic exporter-1
MSQGTGPGDAPVRPAASGDGPIATPPIDASAAAAPAGPPLSTRSFGLSDLALDRPVMVGMILLAIFVLGVIAVAQLPLAFLPASGTARVAVRLDLARTSPELVEREVIRPVEQQMAGLRGLQKIQVGSGGWGVRLNLEFSAGTDIAARKAEIRERLDRIKPELPDTISRISLDSWGRSDGAILELRLASATGLTRNYELLERLIVRPIERIPGVSRVELEGATPRELEVALDLEAVQRVGADLGQVSAVLRSARQGRSLGVLHQDELSPGVRSPAVPADPEAFAALPVPRRSGPSALVTTAAAPATVSTAPRAPPASAAAASAAVLAPPTSAAAVSASAIASSGAVKGAGASTGAAAARLGEVAQVEIHPRENRNFRSLDGQLGVDLAVFADAGASPVEVAAAVRQVVADLQASPRIGDLQVIVFEDQGEIILKTLADLRDTGIYGGLLGVLVLYLFLRRIGATLVAALGIPLTLLATCGVLLLRGEELNCIVLLGLVLGVGMLVDNAVVIVEAIEHHSSLGAPPLQAIRQGGRDVSLATVASTLSSVIVFLPLIFGDPADPMAALLSPLGLTFAIVLVCSLFISQTLVPLLMPAVLRMNRGRPTPPSPIMDRIGGAYGWLIARTLKHRRATLLISLLLAATAVYPAMRLNFDIGELEPRPDQIDVALQFVGSPGYREISGKVAVVESALLARKDELQIAHVSCRYSDFWARCGAHPSVRAEAEAEVEAFTERIAKALPEQAGVRYLLGEEAQGMWRGGGGDRRVVELAIKGEDMSVLMRLGEQAAEHLRRTLPRGDPRQPDAGGYDSVVGPYDEGSRELHVKLDSAALHRYGLRADEVSRLIQTAFQGLPLGQVRGPDGQIELRLSADGGRREGEDEGDGPSLEELRDLKIPVRGGAGVTEVAVGSLARFERTRSPFFVQRVDRETQVKVKVRYFTADPKANREAVNQAMAGFSFPAGYSSGEPSRWRGGPQGQGALIINLCLCLLLVYAVMASLFESFLQPFAILVTCLLGCLGAPWAIWWTDTTVDITAMIGLFILIGIVVNNGIMLVDRTIQLRIAGLPRDEALARAGRDRIRPILMTAGTTILGLVPMLIHHPTLAGVYYHAIALVIAGGLLTSTFVTLVFLPATYSLLEDLALATRARWRWALGLGARRSRR